MGKIRNSYKSTLIAVSVLFLPFLSMAQDGEKKPDIDWMSWSEAIKANRKKESRKFMIDVYTSWCGWCKKMDKNTFQKPAVASYINEHFWPVKLDAERKDDIIFNNDTMEFMSNKGRKGTHELALRLMQGKASYPTVVFLDERVGMISPVPGYKKPKQMIPLLEFINKEIYKQDTKFQTYLKNYYDEGEKESDGKEEDG